MANIVRRRNLVTGRKYTTTQGYAGANYTGQTPQPQQQPMHAGTSAPWGGGDQGGQTVPPDMPPEDYFPF